jgi:hypothetical protein
MTASAPAPSPPSPASATTPATDLLDLMMRLADLLAHETELMRGGHVADMAPLQREKLRLALIYQKAIKDLTGAGVKLMALPAPLRAQIIAASHRLAEVVSDNERALRIGRAAARRLLDMVVESVKEKLKPLNRYNAKLTAPRGLPMLAVAVDRRM